MVETNKAALLQPIRSRRLSQIVADQIGDLIEDGQLSVGRQLPGERVLADQLSVSRTAVREALRVLEAKGTVQVEPGKGAYVLSLASQADLLSGLMVWLEQEGDVREMISVCMLLDGFAAHLAAQTASRDDMEQMRTAMTDMHLATERKSLEDMITCDRAFHRFIYQASHNGFLVVLADSVQATLARSRTSSLGYPGRAQQSLEEHQATLEAIAAGDAEEARRAASLHVSNALELLALLEQAA